MSINMGGADRIIRFLIGAGLLAWILTGGLAMTSLLGIIGLVVGGVFVLTSMIGLCPLYSLLGIRTGGKK